MVFEEVWYFYLEYTFRCLMSWSTYHNCFGSGTLGYITCLQKNQNIPYIVTSILEQLKGELFQYENA